MGLVISILNHRLKPLFLGNLKNLGGLDFPVEIYRKKMSEPSSQDDLSKKNMKLFWLENDELMVKYRNI